MLELQQTTTATNQQTQPCFESRWGWHPLPYQSYLQLKDLYKWCFESWYKHCKFQKWCRKKYNKPASPPPIDRTFTQLLPVKELEKLPFQQFQIVLYIPMIQYQKTEEGIKRIKIFGKFFNCYEQAQYISINKIAEQIIDTFQICRHPAPKPEEVKFHNEETEPILTEQQIKQLWNTIIQQPSCQHTQNREQ